MSTTKLTTSVLLSLLLSACAAQQAFRDGQKLIADGNSEAGLAKLALAYQLDSDKTDYRSTYFNQREMTVFRWLDLAEQARKQGMWDEAELQYLRVFKIDPDNVRAKTGLSNLANDKKYNQQLSDAKQLLDNNELSAAAQKVRSVLSDAPSHPSALLLQKNIEAKFASSQTNNTLKAKLTNPISIEFKDAALPAVLDAISKSAGINFMLDKEVRADIRVTLFVREARIEDVVRFILTTNQLDSRVLNNNTLYIYPKSAQKQRDLQELQVKNFYLTNAAAKDVSVMLKSILKTKDVYVDERLNLIILRDTPDLIQVAERLVAAQDMADPEVMLDVEVLEVGSNVLDNIGIQYPSLLSFSLIGADKTAGTLALNELKSANSDMIRATISDPTLVLSLLHQHGDSKKLANPKIRAKNHEKAKIHIGDKLPVISNTTTSNGVTSQSITYLDVGLKLDVEPTVHLNNDVAIKVGLEVSNVVKQIQNTDGSLTYQVGTRNASTTLRLKDGETQILAGLIKKEGANSTNGLPGLSQLPILGRLFGRRNDTAENSEVVLLITPRVIRNIVRPESPVEVFSSGTEADISLERMQMNPVQNQVPPKVETSVEPISSKAAIPPPTPTLASNSTPKLSLMLPEKVLVDQSFSATLNLASSGVRSAIFEFTYDTQKVKLLNVVEGELIKKMPDKNQFSMQIREADGHINVEITRLADIADDGSIVQLSFQALASGDSNINIHSANLTDAAGKMITYEQAPHANTNITP